MDQSTLVEEQITDGRRLVARFAADGNPVQAAFWVKTAEEGMWFLYVAAEIIDRLGPAAAYRAMHASLRKLGSCCVSSTQIKVVSPSNPIVNDVLIIMARHPDRISTNGKTLGPMAVEQTIVYPSRAFTFTQANPMTPDDIGLKILRLMSRGPAALQPSHVILKDGTTFHGVPFSLELGTQRAMVVRLIADGEAVPRVVQLDDISSIN